MAPHENVKLDESGFDDEGFNYVVEINYNPKVCFGSITERCTDPIGKGLSPFQKRNAPELFRTGPGSYPIETYTSSLYPILNKIRSNRGIGSLAGNDQRFKDTIVRTPSPSRYEPYTKKTIQRSSAPFGCKAKLKSYEIQNIPGAATYDISKTRKCRRTKFSNNFGRPKMINAIELACVPEPSDRCHKCNAICEGDYWHLDYNVFLCHLCWIDERQLPDLYSKKELKTFKKLRNCSFMHNHEGTTAATLILPPKKIKKKIYLENYLDLYIEC